MLRHAKVWADWRVLGQQLKIGPMRRHQAEMVWEGWRPFLLSFLTLSPSVLFVFTSKTWAAHYPYLPLLESIVPALLSTPTPPPIRAFLIAKSMLGVCEQGISGAASEHGYPLTPLPRNLCMCAHILPSVPSQPALKHNHQASSLTRAFRNHLSHSSLHPPTAHFPPFHPSCRRTSAMLETLSGRR